MDRSSRGSESGYTSPELGITDDRARSTTPSGSVRSRDMSPESLRRFLSDDVPFGQPSQDPSPKLWIPDEIVEEIEDDDNFATSAASESAPVTMLSPPPSQHSTSSSLLRSKNESTATIVPGPKLDTDVPSAHTESFTPFAPTNYTINVNVPRSHFSFSTTSSSSPTSPLSRSTKSRDRSNHSFLDDSDDDCDDYMSPSEDDLSPRLAGTKKSEVTPPTRPTPLANYSLPYQSLGDNKPADLQRRPTFGSPELIARNENGVPVGNTHLLSLPHIDSGLEDLANEISWIADVIRPRDY
ncbi:hypothetical protein SLS62_008334 [Diatrype stigma]|uniref:Uncharacterized protein n=1 Tax=Diatrype stigma TaxID=117547 RepID=A0AAN9YP49_9PEZI